MTHADPCASEQDASHAMGTIEKRRRDQTNKTESPVAQIVDLCVRETPVALKLHTRRRHFMPR
jgi:hypothetical protein